MNITGEETDWDIIIKPKTSYFQLGLKDTWRYRDLLVLLVKRDFVSIYKQTILGPLWFFIQPFFTMLVYTFIFGGLAGLSSDGLPRPLFYMAGITAWNYFADCILKTSNVFRDNSGIFGKVFFPRLILPFSIAVSNLIRFAIQFFLFLLMIVYYYFHGVHFHFNLFAVILFPVLVLMMALLGLGLGLLVTAMTTKYRDLSFLLTFGIQLLMYATTVIYPLSAAPHGLKKFIELNPLTGIIEAFRYIFLGAGEFTIWSLGYSFGFAIVSFILGVIVFNKAEKTFVDTV